MNIPILHLEPADCVKEMPDKALHGAAYMNPRLLSDAIRRVEGDRKGIYPVMFTTDKAIDWLVESDCNYMWFYELTKRVWDEWAFRYKKVHKSSLMAPLLEPPMNGLGRKASTHTCPPLELPDKYLNLVKTIGDPWVRAIQANRAYYIQEAPTSKWTLRAIPLWFSQGSSSRFTQLPVSVKPVTGILPADATAEEVVDAVLAKKVAQQLAEQMDRDIMDSLTNSLKHENDLKLQREAEEAYRKKFPFKKIRPPR